ncbi:hypothetical protein EUGRSUZ_B02450 [Eucalyptus grandis]|uniref:Uncharacterized protein n=3 Tax=Eucalyptus TaxID=3932 RepID=A0ACC3LTK3_EUCGR|nr:hypothetical protein EUGRSUZ_B02450 [Eucalyptus grandis]
MATAPSPPRGNGSGNGNGRLPPKRGQIKAQIFEGFVKTLSSAAAKAGNAIGLGSTGATSGTGSPPPSGYNSEGNANNPS